MSGLKFRGPLIEDAEWIAKAENDQEASKYWDAFPRTGHEFEERIRKVPVKAREKTIVAEPDSEPVG